MPVSIEQHVEWISDCLAYLREHGIDTIEATGRTRPTRGPSTSRRWPATPCIPKAASWYMGANIPGKPRLFLPYIGGVGLYRDKCDAIAADGYEGFELSQRARRGDRLARAARPALTATRSAPTGDLMALDDATAAWLDELAQDPAEAGHELTPAEAREQSAAARAQRGPGTGDGPGPRHAGPGGRRCHPGARAAAHRAARRA